jgi:hypothetical protein
VPRRLGDPRSLFILALFTALSIAWTWPLVLRLGSRVAFDPGDPFLNTWILWWNAQAIPFTDQWWSPPIFYPMRGALALSEHLAGIAFFTTPLLHLGATPAFGYNVALLLSYALSGFFAYALTLRLSGSPAAALCAGLAFAFAPIRAGQLSHLQVLTAQWLPLQLLALHAYLDSGRRRWLAIFGCAWVLQALSNGYYLLFAPVLLGAWVAWFVIAARKWAALRGIAAASLLASLPLVPVVLTYQEVHRALGLTRSRAEMINLSAGLHSFLSPPPTLALWRPRRLGPTEDFLFPGITIVAVIAAALLYLAFTRARTTKPPVVGPFLFYVAAAVLMAGLTLGPAVQGDGVMGWLKPYEWLVRIPGYAGLRVPARFGMLMALCLSIAGGLGLAMLLPAGRGGRAVAAGVVALGISLDGWMQPLGVSVPAARVLLPDVPGAAVLELPASEVHVNVRAMFRSMTHRRPLINGYSGYVPKHYAILAHSLRRKDPSALIELARGRPLQIVLAERDDPSGFYRRLVESLPGIGRAEVSGAGGVYLLPAQPQILRPRGGTSRSFTAALQPRSHVVLDLGSAQVVRSFEFPLRNRYLHLGERVAIEASSDGVNWTTAWEGWTGGAALAGALEDQVRVPVRFVVPDVTARYLRIHPAQDWLIDELRVLGP